MSSWNGQSLLGRLLNLQSMISRDGYQFSAGRSYSVDQQTVGSKRAAPQGGNGDDGYEESRPSKSARHVGPGSNDIIGASSAGGAAGLQAVAGPAGLFHQRLLAHAQRIANEL